MQTLKEKNKNYACTGLSAGIRALLGGEYGCLGRWNESWGMKAWAFGTLERLWRWWVFLDLPCWGRGVGGGVGGRWIDDWDSLAAVFNASA